jgi:hypothetical protein
MQERKGSKESIIKSIDKSQESIISGSDNIENKSRKMVGLETQANININTKPEKVK